MFTTDKCFMSKWQQMSIQNINLKYKFTVQKETSRNNRYAQIKTIANITHTNNWLYTYNIALHAARNNITVKFLATSINSFFNNVSYLIN